MGKNKFGVTFEGFEELMAKLDALDGDLKKVTNECLDVAHEIITPKLHQAMKKHYQTGDTEKSIVDHSSVKWEGMTANVDVGFKIRNGGLPSIFLMYGTPRMKKDTALYNAVYGKKVKDEIAKMQALILADEIHKRMGG